MFSPISLLLFFFLAAQCGMWNVPHQGSNPYFLTTSRQLSRPQIPVRQTAKAAWRQQRLTLSFEMRSWWGVGGCVTQVFIFKMDKGEGGVMNGPTQAVPLCH